MQRPRIRPSLPLLFLLLVIPLVHSQEDFCESPCNLSVCAECAEGLITCDSGCARCSSFFHLCSCIGYCQDGFTRVDCQCYGLDELQIIWGIPGPDAVDPASLVSRLDITAGDQETTTLLQLGALIEKEFEWGVVINGDSAQAVSGGTFGGTFANVLGQIATANGLSVVLDEPARVVTFSTN